MALSRRMSIKFDKVVAKLRAAGNWQDCSSILALQDAEAERSSGAAGSKLGCEFGSSTAEESEECSEVSGGGYRQGEVNFAETLQEISLGRSLAKNQEITSRMVDCGTYGSCQV